ncbi:MAG: membrane dipeptidase [Clostridia bacterium]|nr:membrane dipeptidase [Clostridia bacterium]
MRYFDLHCDTLYKALSENKSLTKNDLCVSFEKGSAFKPWVQCFAIWIPDDLRGESAFSLAQKAYEFFLDQIAFSDGKITLCKNKTDLQNIKNTNSCGAVFTIEGSAALAENLENLSVFSDMGLKIMTLTWNEDCESGSGISSFPDLGLTDFGKQLLLEMEKLNIIPDISHASLKLFYDVADIYPKPIIATHSNSKTICTNKRNLSDEQFNIIKQKNGIIGLNYYKEFLNNDPQKASVCDILRHTEYFLSLGGEDIVCMGSDFDGADMPKDIKGIESVYDIANCFLRHNYSETMVNKILFDNAYNFFINSFTN